MRSNQAAADNRPRIATSFTAWFPTKNEFPEAACRRQTFVAPNGAPRIILRRVPRVAAETALPWAIISRPLRGLGSIWGFASRPLRFQKNRKRKERKGDAEFAKEESRHECTDRKSLSLSDQKFEIRDRRPLRSLRVSRVSLCGLCVFKPEFKCKERKGDAKDAKEEGHEFTNLIRFKSKIRHLRS